MFDYTTIGYKQIGDPVTTESGMRRVRYEQEGKNGLNTIIASEFSEKHPMFKKYGIREMKVSGYCGHKPEYYTLTADVFGKRIEFKARPQIFSEIKANKEVSAFLKRLKRAVKYKNTPFLENLAAVAKYIK